MNIDAHDGTILIYEDYVASTSKTALTPMAVSS